MNRPTTNSDISTDLPNIGAPARRALAGIGVDTLAGVCAYSASELLALHGFGPKALRILEEALAGKGLRLEED